MLLVAYLAASDSANNVLLSLLFVDNLLQFHLLSFGSKDTCIIVDVVLEYWFAFVELFGHELVEV